MTTDTRLPRSRLLRGSLIVMAGYLLSRVTGLLRDVLILGSLGTSDATDAYRAAFQLPDLLYLVVIGGALGSTLIPAFVESRARAGPGYAWRLASVVTTWSLLILLLASLALALLAEPLSRLLYAGFPEEKLQLTVALTRLFLLSPLLLGLGGLAMALLNALDRFTLPALAPSVYNIGICAGALLAPRLGVWGPAFGVVAGALAYLLLLLPGLAAAGARFQLALGRGMPELPAILQQLAPRVLGQSAAHLSAVATIAFATRLPDGEGQVAALSYAYQVMLLPFGIVSLSLSTVAFPTLARLHATASHAEFAARVRRTAGTILFLALPSAAVLVVLADPLIRLLFERGQFDAASVALTRGPLMAYATALPAFALSEILIRSFYAMRQTLVPVAVGLGAVTLNVTLGAVALARGWGAPGLALVFSLANNLECLALAFLLGRAHPGLWRDRTLHRLGLAALVGSGLLVGMLLLGLTVLAPRVTALGGGYLWPSRFLELAGWTFLLLAAGAGLYLLVARLLGVRPRRDLLQ